MFRVAASCQLMASSSGEQSEALAEKQPYAIARKDGSPFGLAGLWENWRDPNTDEWERTLL